MVYEIKSNTTLFEIDRAEIVDISVGDMLQTKAFPQCQYTWTQQDSQFVESNPDAKVYLQIEHSSDNTYKHAGLMVVPANE